MHAKPDKAHFPARLPMKLRAFCSKGSRRPVALFGICRVALFGVKSVILIMLDTMTGLPYTAGNTSNRAACCFRPAVIITDTTALFFSQLLSIVYVIGPGARGMLFEWGPP